MALRGGGAKAKGATGERELAALLGGWAADLGVPLDLSRNLEQTRAGGYDLLGVPGLAIECKRVEALALGAWWAQAVRQADAKGETPFLAWRQNRRPWAFRTRGHVAFYGPEASGTACLDIDLTFSQAEIWFKSYVWFNVRPLVEKSTETPLVNGTPVL